MRGELNTYVFRKELAVAIEQDFYHSPAYVTLDAELLDGRALLFDLPEAYQIPLIMRRIPECVPGLSAYDVVSPYGYPGIVCVRPQEVLTAAEFEPFMEACRNQQIISAFIRLHPFHNAFSIEETRQIRLGKHGSVVYVDLTKPYEEIYSGFSNNHKRDLRTLRRQGFTSRVNDFAQLGPFVHAYRSTMAAVGAGSYYLFGDAYFQSLKEIFAGRFFLITAVDPLGQFASGALFIETNGLVQYHLGATSDQFRKAAASKMVFDTAIQYFAARKRNLLHLGGGVASIDDALFLFKIGFSKLTKRFRTLRIITDPEAYESVEKQHKKTKTNFDPNFFPAYRS